MPRLSMSIKQAFYNLFVLTWPDDWLFLQMGFFAMVGPLQVFVSCHVSHSSLLFPLHFSLFILSHLWWTLCIGTTDLSGMLIYAGRSCSNWSISSWSFLFPHFSKEFKTDWESDQVLLTCLIFSLLTRIWNSTPAFRRRAIAQMTKLFKRIPKCEYKL